MKAKLLKQYRAQALNTLDFFGGWSGYWTLRIDGVRYRSERVSGFKFVVNDTGSFIQDCLIDRVKQLRNKTRIDTWINVGLWD